jgi:hypothetical protein
MSVGEFGEGSESPAQAWLERGPWESNWWQWPSPLDTHPELGGDLEDGAAVDMAAAA